MNLELTQKQAEILYGVLAYGRIDVDRVLVDIENRLRAEIEASQHTEKYKADRAAERKALVAYEHRWPRYCRKCGGEGGVSGPEYRGECHGTPAYEDTYYTCPDCIEKGLCPRCGSISNNFEEEDVQQLECATCGWKEGDSGAPVVEHDCGCLYPE